jgi:hypothetical protein
MSATTKIQPTEAQLAARAARRARHAARIRRTLDEPTAWRGRTAA